MTVTFDFSSTHDFFDHKASELPRLRRRQRRFQPPLPNRRPPLHPARPQAPILSNAPAPLLPSEPFPTLTVVSLPQCLLSSLPKKCSSTKIFSPFFPPRCSLYE